jgi:hypothetical protein
MQNLQPPNFTLIQSIDWANAHKVYTFQRKKINKEKLSESLNSLLAVLAQMVH